MRTCRRAGRLCWYELYSTYLKLPFLSYTRLRYYDALSTTLTSGLVCLSAGFAHLVPLGTGEGALVVRMCYIPTTTGLTFLSLFSRVVFTWL